MAALITPEELIVFLDLPADTQPTDRAQLACTLVLDAVTDAAGQVLAEPYPAGLKAVALTAAGRLYDNPTAMRAQTIDDYSATYAGAAGVLTDAEAKRIGRIFGAGSRPLYSFPAWDWSWTASSTSTITD